MHRQHPVGRPHVVYLGGFGRSGSTLLERVLGGIPGWTNVGELVDLPRSVHPHNELCGCGRDFSDCSFWSEVGRRAHGEDGWSHAALQRLVDLRQGIARQRQLGRLLVAARTGAGADDFIAKIADYQRGSRSRFTIVKSKPGSGNAPGRMPKASPWAGPLLASTM